MKKLWLLLFPITALAGPYPGAGPYPIAAPFVGSLMTTNFSQPLAVSYWVYPVTNSTTRYVETTGNDATAVAGNSSLPWLTFTGAVANATAGTRIKFGTGSWTIYTTNGGYDVPLGLWLQGNGQSLTHLVSTNGVSGYWLNFTNNTIVQDLSIDRGSVIPTGLTYPVVFGPHDGRGGNWSPVTNVLFQNVRIEGDSDTHSPNGGDYIDFVNCQFISHWDCMTCKYQGTTTPNGKIRHFGCLFYTRINNDSDQANFVTGGISSGGALSCVYNARGNTELHGCTLICTNAKDYSLPIYNLGGFPTVNVWVDDCTIVNQPASTNINNIPGGTAYYAVVGPAWITGHPIPDIRTYQCQYTTIADNSFNYLNGMVPSFVIISNSIYYSTNYSAANQYIRLDPTSTGSTFSSSASFGGGPPYGVVVSNAAAANQSWSSAGTNWVQTTNATAANSYAALTNGSLFVTSGANLSGVVTNNGAIFSGTNTQGNIWAPAVDATVPVQFMTMWSTNLTINGISGLELVHCPQPVTVISNAHTSPHQVVFPAGTRIMQALGTNQPVAAASVTCTNGKTLQIDWLIYPHLGQMVTNAKVWIQTN